MAGCVHRNDEAHLPGSHRAADVVSGLVQAWLAPSTVLDVGCGAGAFLDAFRARGCTEVHGLDGPWSPLAGRRPDVGLVDFEHDPAEQWEARRPRSHYDLVLSLEVAEHLQPELADAFTEFLCRSAGSIVFSAAIPLQGGQHHVNEQWPGYWISRFAAHGFAPFDILRLALWEREEVPAWYRQNILLFFRGAIPPRVREEGERLALRRLHQPMGLVHPDVYGRRLGRILLALTRPHRFLALLARERRTGVRETPRLR